MDEDMHDDRHTSYLRLALACARVGLAVVDRDHRYVYAHPAYAETLGLPSREIAGQFVADVLHESYADHIKPRLSLAFAGTRVMYELQRRTAAGDCFFYSVTYEPSRAPDGTVELVVVVLTDVTQQKADYEASRRLAAIVESSDDAIIG